MKVYFVGAGPGDPELLTLKAQRLLKDCQVCIYAGSLVSPHVLALVPQGCERHDSSALDLEEISRLFDDAAKRSLSVVRLHSGDPSIYGAITEQMNELDRLGIDYEVVPGISSFQASAAALCAELTAPEISQTIILTRTSGRTPVPSEQEIGCLAQTHATLCIFLSIQKIDAIASTLSDYYGPDCPVAVVYRASWPDQRIIRGALSDIAQRVSEFDLTRTAMIIVGRALSRKVPPSKLYDSAFSHAHRSARST